MLTADELSLWAVQVGRALYDASVIIRTNAYRVDSMPATRKKAAHVLLQFDCPHWVRGRRAAVELYADAAMSWVGPDATVREIGRRLRADSPRYMVPPQGDVPFAVSLTEHNGWEGEAWTFYLPIAHEDAVRKLVDLHVPSEGQDVRSHPLEPRSLAHFGSWSIKMGYLRAEDAQRIAASSGHGYMRNRSWCPSAGPQLDALIAAARGLDLMRWDQHDGLGMWKGRVTLTQQKNLLGAVTFEHEGPDDAEE